MIISSCRSWILTGLVLCGFGAQAKPLALIYKGPGSCEQTAVSGGCSEAAAKAAEQAGFQVQYVGPNEKLKAEVWSKAKLWIQPGGRAKIQIQTMSPQLVVQIRDFVNQGGGYVGFCAGAFLAAEKFGWQDEDPKYSFESDALGLIKGYGHYFDEYDKELSENHLAKIVKVKWGRVTRNVYWELGPYFDQTSVADGKFSVVASYPDAKGRPRADRIMTAKGSYGRGRVSITAVHPEAPEDWRTYYKITDPDGEDLDLAVEMIQWAAGQ